MKERPPLLSLEYFVVTAREGSVRGAADKLSITPSAVSHQIAKLEQYLNTNLFLRYKQRLILTEGGKQYLEQVESSLDRIGSATRDIAVRNRRRRLTISAPPTFLTFWLLPRLPSLMRKYPDLDLHLVDAMTIDLSRDDIDCGVEYRLHPNSRLESEKLFDDEVIAVASPHYVSSQKIRRLEDLRRCTLIETEERPWSWSNVLRHFTWRHDCPSIVMNFTYQSLTSAVFGHGVALTNRQNAEYLILQKRLTIPFTLKDPTHEGPAYYFSCTPENAASPTVRAMKQWMLSRDQLKLTRKRVPKI